MNVGTMEERTEGMKRQAQELIEQAYQRGYKAGREACLDDCIKYIDVNQLVEQGRNEAWAAAQKILNVCCSSSSQVLDKVFGTPSVLEIMNTCPASEAIEKLSAYEEQNKREDDEEIKVGDEVVTVTGDKGVVTGISNNDVYLFISGCKITQVRHKLCCKKTGRTFLEFAEVLDKISDSE